MQHDEMKFLIPFYAAIAVVVAGFLLFTLFGTELAALALVVVALFAAMIVLAVETIHTGANH